MSDQYWMFIAGGIVVLMGLTGLSNKTRRNRWLMNILGSVGNRIFYIVMGLIFIGVGFFLF